MDQKEVARVVADRSGLSREESADIVRAVLEGIADQLSEGQVRQLAAELPILPARAQAPRRRRQGAHPVRLLPFIRHLSARTGLTDDEASAGTGAVLGVLRQTLGGDEYRRLMAQLPTEYDGLVQTAR
ncbi:MAG TPA: DUF2267 domain-containing protein [Streptosporangiaceae bacterium]|nr:DUF2267 domain-containing protein [Streptosporangiaceae bacterium]